VVVGGETENKISVGTSGGADPTLCPEDVAREALRKLSREIIAPKDLGHEQYFMER